MGSIDKHAELMQAEKPQSSNNLPRTLDAYTLPVDQAVGKTARKLLEEYSGIPADEVNEHVLAIRSKAFAIHHYPCIGGFRFLSLSMSSMPIYPKLVSRLKSGDKLLDLGCCFGQEIRQLIADGVPGENLYGSDLRQSFWDLGYDLFRDKERLKATFIAADIFDPQSPLKQLEGQMDIVYTGSFFHLFDLPEQHIVAKKVIALLKPAPGSTILGRHMGNLQAQAFDRPGGEKKYRHSPESWREFWNEAGRETGTRWEADVEAEDVKHTPWAGGRNGEGRDDEAGTRRLRFVVRRVE